MKIIHMCCIKKRKGELSVAHFIRHTSFTGKVTFYKLKDDWGFKYFNINQIKAGTNKGKN